jgi:flagellar biosynthesis/type III secretory pathway protein FliH
MLLKRFIAPVVTAVVLAAPVSLFAQAAPWALPSAAGRYAPADDAQVSYSEARRIAYDQGYRQGVKEGEKDVRRGERHEYRDEREFQRADRGYNRNFGDRERYRQLFREGYSSGYTEAYSRYGRYSGDSGAYGRSVPYGVQSGRGPYAQRGSVGVYGGPSGYYSPAFDNGARDGFEKGQEDARKNRSFDVLRHEWYREGDRHYENQYGSRQQYKDVYRRGFQQGYDQGFREGRYTR